MFPNSYLKSLLILSYLLSLTHDFPSRVKDYRIDKLSEDRGNGYKLKLVDEFPGSVLVTRRGMLKPTRFSCLNLIWFYVFMSISSDLETFGPRVIASTEGLLQNINCKTLALLQEGKETVFNSAFVDSTY